MDFVMLFAVGFIGAITPGPDILLVMHNSLRFGGLAGIRALCGIATGWMLFLGIIYFGFANVFKGALAQILIGFAGGLYLLYIAFMLYKKPPSDTQTDSHQATGFFKALLINLSNPKAILFFGVIITPFMDTNLRLSLIVLFISLLSAFLVVIFASIFCKRYLNDKTFALIDKICSVLFFVFALSLLYRSTKLTLEIL